MKRWYQAATMAMVLALWMVAAPGSATGEAAGADDAFCNPAAAEKVDEACAEETAEAPAQPTMDTRPEVADDACDCGRADCQGKCIHGIDDGDENCGDALDIVALLDTEQGLCGCKLR